ncbi:MAG: C25 family cysteine peptidase [Tahibacter sp.]
MLSSRFFLVIAALGCVPALASACSGSLHIELESAGVYALDQPTLFAKQPALADCPRDSLVLTQAGKPVAIRITGSGATLADTDRIEWVGEPLHGPLSWFDAYSTVNVYQLSSQAGAHPRILDVAPDAARGAGAALTRRVHLEQENLMIRLNQNLVKVWEEPDYWHWAKMTHVDPAPFEFSFDLPDLAARGGDVAVNLRLRGISVVASNGHDPKPVDHRLDVRLDGHTVAELSWEGRDEVSQHVVLPLSALRDKGNRVSLVVPKRKLAWEPATQVVDVVMFNSAEMDYPIRGNLNISSEPFRSNGGTPNLQLAGSTPSLYSGDGHRYIARFVTDGEWRFANLPARAELYPVFDEKLHKPLLVRAQSNVDWHAPKQAWDYLIISHARLIQAIEPLAEFHRQRGLKVAVIDVNDVYDAYNHGVAHPSAIRAMLQEAYREWPQPRPRFALLVGDASFDIRHERIDRLAIAKWADRELLEPGHFGDIPSTPYADKPADLPNRNLIPTWQFPSYDGQSASDNHFASVGDDPLHPVIAIGRFPVVEPAEVKAIVDKTINYLRSPEYGAWRRDVMFITDESDYFKNTSDQVAATLDSVGFAADKVYASSEEKDNIAHQSAIKDGLNQGRLLVHFIGHGGRYIWRTGPPDLRKNHDLFTLEDVSGLNNAGRLPMILSMTCYSAPFDNPTEDSIGERFLREADKGAIAVFAASWRNSPSPDYSKAIISELTKPGQSIGTAIVAGKARNNDATLVETYNLLGDPALILERPEGDLTLQRRSTPFGGTRVQVDLARPSFSGRIAADWVDEKGKILHTEQFSALGARFVLPNPPRGVLENATEVRAYAADARQGFDAIGRIVLREAAKPAVQPSRGPASPASLDSSAAQKIDGSAKFAPVRDGADPVMRGGFDQSSPESKGKTRVSGGEPDQSSRKALLK